MGIKLTGESVKKSSVGSCKFDSSFKKEEIKHGLHEGNDDDIAIKHYFNRPKNKSKDESKKNTKSDKDEELIMIMMPKITWNAFQDLAEKYGGTPSQAISTALKLLEETLKKNA